MNRICVGLPILLAIIALAPLWLIPINFWDGRIVDYAMTTGDLRGLKVWFFESRWNLQYWLYVVIRLLAEITRINPQLWFAATASFAILGIAAETYRYAMLTFRLPRPYALIAGYSALFFPAWHTLASSDLLIHVLCVWLMMMGYRLSKSWPVLIRCLGGACIVASFQLNSLFVVLVGMCAAECLLELWYDRRIAADTKWRGIFLTGLAVIVFLMLKAFFPPYGLYAGYNQIAIFDSLADMVKAIRLVGRYMGWLAVALGLSVSGYLIAIGMAALDWRNRRQSGFPLRKVLRRFGLACARNGGVLLAISLLFIVAVMPYVAVHKYAKFGAFYDWSHRNAYTLCVPLSLLVAWLSRLMTISLRETGQGTKHASLIPVVCCCGFASLLYVGYSQKVQRSSFELGVIRAMKALPPPAAGMVYLRYDHLRGLTIRTYESNWLLWRAYGRLEWISQMSQHGSSRAIKLSESMRKAMASGDKEYRLEYLLPGSRNAPCHTDILLTGNWLSAPRAWAWLFGWSPLPKLTATVNHASCPGISG